MKVPQKGAKGGGRSHNCLHRPMLVKEQPHRVSGEHAPDDGGAPAPWRVVGDLRVGPGKPIAVDQPALTPGADDDALDDLSLLGELLSPASRSSTPHAFTVATAGNDS
jgi:hypothetical protein